MLRFRQNMTRNVPKSVANFGKQSLSIFSSECKCNLQGSKNNNCRPDSGKCECKDGYSGIHCELSIGENIYCILIWNDREILQPN